MTMIERVAKALYENFFTDEWPPADAPDLGMDADNFRKAARAAIEAMREPTEEMIKRGHLCDPLGVDVKAGGEAEDVYGTTWRAMIDAALADARPPDPR